MGDNKGKPVTNHIFLSQANLASLSDLPGKTQNLEVAGVGDGEATPTGKATNCTQYATDKFYVIG
jgi:hypothetical protein